MKSKKVLEHALRPLCAMLVLLSLAAGCGKDEAESGPKEAVYPAEGHAYMKDPEFKKQIDAQEAEKKSVLDEREALITAFKLLEKRSGSREAAQKLPEWKRLEARARKCGQRFEEIRRKSMEIFEERLKRAEKDSERIRRGEAVAK